MQDALLLCSRLSGACQSSKAVQSSLGVRNPTQSLSSPEANQPFSYVVYSLAGESTAFPGNLQLPVEFAASPVSLGLLQGVCSLPVEPGQPVVCLRRGAFLRDRAAAPPASSTGEPRRQTSRNFGTNCGSRLGAGAGGFGAMSPRICNRTAPATPPICASLASLEHPRLG